MTTIATDGKSMAGDGLVTGSGIIHGFAERKVRKLSDGRIVGLCGSIYFFEEALKWLENGGDKPSHSDEFEMFVLHPGGRLQSFDRNLCAMEQETPAVTGSGGPIALGAMLAGASPAEAVSFAAQRDMSTGGTITVETLS